MDLKEIKKPKIYSMDEVAKFIGVSKTTLYRMIKDGRIKPLNIAKSGTKPLHGFRAEDIQAYYDSFGSKGIKDTGRDLQQPR